MISPREAEVACEWYWRSHGAVHTRRALRTKFARVDFFGADVIAKAAGWTTWSQVTTTQRENNVRVRRRKLEAIPWLPTDGVFVFEVEERPGVVNKRRADYFFRVHELVHDGRLDWTVRPEPIPIPRAWFKVKEEGQMEVAGDEAAHVQAPARRRVA